MRIGGPALDHQVRMELLEEWDQQSGGIFSAMLQGDQCDGNHDAGSDLIAEFGARGEAEIAAMNDFEIIVGKSDGREGERGEDGDPDERIAEVGPEQCGHENRDGDQQAAHGRSAGFFLVRLRTLFADVLADLKIAQTLNHDRPDDQSGEKRGEAGEGSAKSQIAENAEWRKIMVELQV